MREDTPWLEVTEFADGWKLMDDKYADLYPPPRACWHAGAIHVQVPAVREDEQPGVEGERVFRLPEELRTGERLSMISTVLEMGRFRIQEEVIDAEGWALIPRVIVDRPSTPEDLAALDEVSP